MQALNTGRTFCLIQCNRGPGRSILCAAILRCLKCFSKRTRPGGACSFAFQQKSFLSRGACFNVDPKLFGCVFAVMFLAIDLTACAILLAVDLALFLAGQLAAVGLTIRMNLLVDALLAILRPGCLAGCH